MNAYLDTDSYLNFGKYAGESCIEVVKKNPYYFVKLLDLSKISNHGIRLSDDLKFEVVSNYVKLLIQVKPNGKQVEKNLKIILNGVGYEIESCRWTEWKRADEEDSKQPKLGTSRHNHTRLFKQRNIH